MFDLMTDEITIESLESEIQFDKMYKDALIYLITESDAGTTPSTTEQEMSKGPSKFRKFVDSVIDFISDIINKAQSYLIAFFTDKEIVMNIKKINDIVNKTRLKTLDSSKLLNLVEDYRIKMEHDKEHSADIFKKYEEARKKLIDSGEATNQYTISDFLKCVTINNYKNYVLPILRRTNTNLINGINSEIKKIDESDTEKKRMYTNYLNYIRRLLNYQLRDIKLEISSFRYNVERAYKIGELGMKNSRVSII